MTQPTIGRIVHYTLADHDVSAIQMLRSDTHERRQGNPVQADQIYPALVVRVFPGGTEVNGVANLQVFLDGNDTYWGTSRLEGEEPGTWAWPTREGTS